MDSTSTWKDTLEVIKITVSPAIYTTWFSQSFINKYEDLDDRVYVEVGCPTSFSKNQIESRYFGLVQDTLVKIIGKKVEVSFTVKENPDKLRVKSESVAPLFEEVKNDQVFLDILRRSRIRPSFNFENFAVSGSNQLAHVAHVAFNFSLPSTKY
jgi:chromosomal replication initiation ATPase DnaA